METTFYTSKVSLRCANRVVRGLWRVAVANLRFVAKVVEISRSGADAGERSGIDEERSGTIDNRRISAL